jgi:PAS domain S-box-containing protein
VAEEVFTPLIKTHFLDNRIRAITRVLGDYSKGRFNTRRIKLSGKLDDLDGIANGLNMLGDELEKVAILRDYFNNIFHSVSDMLFTLNGKGAIKDVNESVHRQLGYSKEDLEGKLISCVEPEGRSLFTFAWLRSVKENQGATWTDAVFRTASGNNLPVTVSAGLLSARSQRKAIFLIKAQDNTRRHRNEIRVLRTMIDAQEAERLRIARDMHDSLGQKISAVQQQLSLVAENCGDELLKKELSLPIADLSATASEMRDVCFDLLPASLKDQGLLQTVEALASRPPYRGTVDFQIDKSIPFPELPCEVAIDVFRVIQEFITNAINHGRATWIGIRYSYRQGKIQFLLQDDGTGFSTEESHRSGRGLQNVRSRIRSHQGEIVISSAPGKGTSYVFTIPVNET